MVKATYIQTINKIHILLSIANNKNLYFKLSNYSVPGVLTNTAADRLNDSPEMFNSSLSPNSSPYSSSCNMSSTCYGGVYQGEYSIKEVCAEILIDIYEEKIATLVCLSFILWIYEMLNYCPFI